MEFMAFCTVQVALRMVFSMFHCMPLIVPSTAYFMELKPLDTVFCRLLMALEVLLAMSFQALETEDFRSPVILPSVWFRSRKAEPAVF